MTRRTMRTRLWLGVTAITFTAGFFCGSLGQRSAEAQLGDVMKKAGEQGGAVGSVGELGSSIVDMQKHVDGLQKNIDTLKKVKTALGG